MQKRNNPFSIGEEKRDNPEHEYFLGEDRLHKWLQLGHQACARLDSLIDWSAASS
jgi:hypothetical protein